MSDANEPAADDDRSEDSGLLERCTTAAADAATAVVDAFIDTL